MFYRLRTPRYSPCFGIKKPLLIALPMAASWYFGFIGFLIMKKKGLYGCFCTFFRFKLWCPLLHIQSRMSRSNRSSSTDAGNLTREEPPGQRRRYHLTLCCTYSRQSVHRCPEADLSAHVVKLVAIVKTNILKLSTEIQSTVVCASVRVLY